MEHNIIDIDGTLVSGELLSKRFACDLHACKGACCMEGAFGAPLEEKELLELEKIQEVLDEYLTEEGKEAIAAQGIYIKNEEKKSYNTPLIKGKGCAYIVHDNNIASCGIEKAYNDGKIDFRKPVSCHLYPVRITETKTLTAANYERWDICEAACLLGEKLQLPVYRFVKDALIRKFGTAFYDELDKVARKQSEKE